MEQQQSKLSDLNPFYTTCWANTFCTKGSQEPCAVCSTNGLMLLINKLYLPKTNIPNQYIRSDAPTGLSMDADKYIRKIVEITDEGKGLYAYSSITGNGKTSTVTFAALKYLFSSIRKDPYDTDNSRVLFLNTTQFLDRVRKSFNNPDPTLDKLFDDLAAVESSPKLLILDDIGAEKQNEWVSERLYSIINFRISNGLATSYTSNLSIDELELRLGGRIASRVRGSAKQVLFNNKDFRSCNW